MNEEGLRSLERSIYYWGMRTGDLKAEMVELEIRKSSLQSSIDSSFFTWKEMQAKWEDALHE